MCDLVALKLWEFIRYGLYFRGAIECGANIIATGHNADDMAETVLLNILRGDLARLQRCTDIVTGSGSSPFTYIFDEFQNQRELDTLS